MAQANSLPVSIQHKGSIYYRTSKVGIRIATKESAAEYQNADSARVWMTKSGEVYPD